jgi:predicted nucleic-acid-binding Zn-ribbon protein
MLKDICPQCSGRNFIIAAADASGQLHAGAVETLEPNRLYYIVCLQCGHVLRAFVPDPSSLLVLDMKD